jgi:hypothetical protein
MTNGSAVQFLTERTQQPQLADAANRRLLLDVINGIGGKDNWRGLRQGGVAHQSQEQRRDQEVLHISEVSGEFLG